MPQSMNESLINTYPLLYSFRRCPYAMRARLALYCSGMEVILREVVLRDKPVELQELSPKATVPVLVTVEEQVIDESVGIMFWALRQSDPEKWLLQDAELKTAMALIDQNDGQFKHWLDHYKYADRFPEHSASYYREQAEVFIAQLEQKLTCQRYLMAERISVADVAIFPFIRQFAHVDTSWFDQAPYPNVQSWLAGLLESSWFVDVMVKYPQWNADSDVILFGQKR
jgi:glutathione S-transferase